MLARVAAVVSMALIISSEVAVAQVNDSQLLDKQVEILQHTQLSIHLDEKCKFLSSEDSGILKWGSQYVGDMLGKNPMNKLGPSGTILIDAKMHERAHQLPCNADSQAQVHQSVANLRRLKGSQPGGEQEKLYQDWDRLVMATAINGRCHFYEDRVTELLSEEANNAKIKLLNSLHTTEAKGSVNGAEKQIKDRISIAPDTLCDRNSEVLVRMITMHTAGIFYASPTLTPACPINARCPLPR